MEPLLIKGYKRMTKRISISLLNMKLTLKFFLLVLFLLAQKKLYGFLNQGD